MRDGALRYIVTVLNDNGKVAYVTIEAGTGHVVRVR